MTPTIHRRERAPRALPFYLCCGALLALVVSIGAANAQTFTGLGVIPGAATSGATAVSADGSTVVGWCRGNVTRAFRWTRTGGMQDLGWLDSPTPQAEATAVSADGQVVVGWSTESMGGRAFRWTAATGMMSLGVLPGSALSQAAGVSGDGSVVAGWGTFFPLRRHAFRWTTAGMQDLGAGFAGAEAGAESISGDGSVVGGVTSFCSGCAQTGAIWRASGWQLVGSLPGAPSWAGSHVYALNADGTVAVGLSANAAAQNRAYRWTAAGGMQDLGTLPGHPGSVAYGVNAEGSSVVGWCDDRACLWSASGVVDLNTYLPTFGIDLEGWSLTVASGISADGLVIVGYGPHRGNNEAWMADLHPTPRCGSADFNHDGDVATDGDIEAFFACLGGSCCPECDSADFNGDGIPGTDADIEAFFRVLAGGAC